MIEVPRRNEMSLDALQTLLASMLQDIELDSAEGKRRMSLVRRALDHLGARSTEVLVPRDRLRMAYYIDHFIVDDERAYDFELMDKEIDLIDEAMMDRPFDMSGGVVVHFRGGASFDLSKLNEEQLHDLNLLIAMHLRNLNVAKAS